MPGASKMLRHRAVSLPNRGTIQFKQLGDLGSGSDLSAQQSRFTLRSTASRGASFPVLPEAALDKSPLMLPAAQLLNEMIGTGHLSP